MRQGTASSLNFQSRCGQEEGPFTAAPQFPLGALPLSSPHLHLLKREPKPPCMPPISEESQQTAEAHSPQATAAPTTAQSSRQMKAAPPYLTLYEAWKMPRLCRGFAGTSSREHWELLFTWSSEDSPRVKKGSSPMANKQQRLVDFLA